MNKLREETEQLLEKDGWKLIRRLKHTYAYKDSETERYRIGERGIRKQKYTNDGWIKVGGRVSMVAVKEHLINKNGNAETVPAEVKRNPVWMSEYGIVPSGALTLEYLTSSRFKKLLTYLIEAAMKADPDFYRKITNLEG